MDTTPPGANAPQPRLLVAEDDAAMRELLDYNLAHEGFRVTLCENGEEAGELIRDATPDLAILDWMLPKRSGIVVCRDIRANPATARLPVLMLTARAAVEDRLRGFEYGADDYLSKPFEFAELVSRVRALLRRATAAPVDAGGPYLAADIRLDPAKRRVTQGDRQIRLGPKEFGVLECLISEPGRVFSREELLERVWGSDVFVDARTVDVSIARLRQSLGARRGRKPIRTIRLGGYALEDEDSADG